MTIPTIRFKREATKNHRSIGSKRVQQQQCILRRDGHQGYNDCLHFYYVTGPNDWWVHLFLQRHACVTLPMRPTVERTRASYEVHTIMHTTGGTLSVLYLLSSTYFKN